jgi:hypothetical protein
VTSYYVSPGGSDANNGLTTGTPKLTIAAGVALASSSGDIVNLMAGDYPNYVASTTRTGIFLQNYNTDAVTISYAHGGTWATNAAKVIYISGAWTGCTIRRNPSGGSFTIRHTGTPSMTGAPSGTTYLAVGNTHSNTGNYAGIHITSAGSGTIMEDLVIGPIFGYGVSVDSGHDDPEIRRCEIFNTCTGIRCRCDGMIIEDCEIHHNQYMGRSGSEEDFGAEGITFEGGTNWLVSGCLIYENWSEYGSQQYGAEGGCASYFNVPDGQGGTFIGNTTWNNNGFIETGNNLPNLNAGGPNSEIAYNTIFGKNDYQDTTSGLTQPLGGTSAGPFAARAPFMLIRTLRDTDIHHNVFDVTTGSNDNAGLRTDNTGTYGANGNFTGMTIRDNIFRVRFATPIYTFHGPGIGAPMAGVTIHHNTIYYTFDRGTGNVFVSTGTTNDYDLSEGPAAVFAATGWCASDVWGDTNTNAANADPDFVDATNANLLLRNYHLLPGSPAIGTASDGSDRGAYAVAGGTDFFRTATGSVTLADSPVRTKLAPRAISDAMDTNESATGVVVRGLKTSTDAVSLSDAAPSKAGSNYTRYPVGP